MRNWKKEEIYKGNSNNSNDSVIFSYYILLTGGHSLSVIKKLILFNK